jgi:hypothetical protein
MYIGKKIYSNKEKKNLNNSRKSNGERVEKGKTKCITSKSRKNSTTWTLLN